MTITNYNVEVLNGVATSKSNIDPRLIIGHSRLERAVVIVHLAKGPQAMQKAWSTPLSFQEWSVLSLLFELNFEMLEILKPDQEAS